MARKMKIPVEKQIQGIKKALDNPRTPPHLKAGLRKRLEQLEKETGKSGHQFSFPLPEIIRKVL